MKRLGDILVESGFLNATELAEVLGIQKETGKRLRRACNEHGTTMIRSCHYFEGVPSEETLFETAEKCKKFGGEIIKVVAMAKDNSDVERLMSLYDNEPLGRLVAFAMGEAGRNLCCGDRSVGQHRELSGGSAAGKENSGNAGRCRRAECGKCT